MKATPEDVAKPAAIRGWRLAGDASMKATPEDVAKQTPPGSLPTASRGLNEGHARRRGEVAELRAIIDSLHDLPQ